VRSPAARIRRHPRLAVLLALSVLVRVALIPWWHGRDFTVWSLASAATLRGDNIYAHHPHYPHGPFAYLPLFLYVELPFRWLADSSGVSFTVLGKIPMVVADLGVTVLLYRAALRRGADHKRATWVAAAFALNPLVLYNSALYGRFDSVACALLLVCTTRMSRLPADRQAPWWLGAAVAAKTFPVFMIPAALFAVPRRRRPVVLLAVLAVTVAVCVPYLGSLRPLLHDVVLYDGGKAPQGASWWVLLRDWFGRAAAARWSLLGLLAMAGGAVAIGRRLACRDLDLAVAATLVLFLICGKVVLEQYLVWPLPWLLLLTCSPVRRTAIASGTLAAVLSLLALADTESFHPLGRASLPVGLAIAGSAAAYLVAVLAARGQDGEDDQQASGRARRASPSGASPYISSSVRSTL
jgi:hypothetical protein